MQAFSFLWANRPKLALLYGENTVDFYRAVFLSSLGRAFAVMLLVSHAIILFPGTSFLDTRTKLWLAPFIIGLVGLLFCSAWLVEHGKHAASRYFTNFTISAGTMASVVLCGGFIDSHATPYLIAPLVVSFCTSPRNEAFATGSAAFFLPLLFDGAVRYFGWQIPNYTSTQSDTINHIFLLVTLFVTVSISLVFLQKTNNELHFALHKEKQQYKHWATLDPLTEIGNRRAFDLDLETAFNEAKAQDGTFAVLYLDLNAFKPINDQYGHEMGDQVLKIVAQRLSNAIRRSDRIARLGGDEFAILVTGPFDDSALDGQKKRIIDSIEAPISINGGTHRISTSIGQAIYPENGRRTADILRAADMDMYARKMHDKLMDIHPGSSETKLKKTQLRAS